VSGLGLKLIDEVSNDLRPPITVIKGCVETVLSNWHQLDPEARDELLGAALHGADELVVSLEALEARLEAVDRASDRA
jgi:K+-sensing histidine kinase KdpD